MGPMTFVLEGRFADRDTWSPTRCPIAKAFSVIGTRSAILVLREAYYGTRRFDDFARRVGLTDSAAAGRLRELVEAGLFEKVAYQEPGQRTRYEYHLTQMGRDLMPAIVALISWGDTYLQGDDGPALALTHLGCGEEVVVEVRCQAGHVLAPGDIAVRPGGKRPSRGSPAARTPGGDASAEPTPGTSPPGDPPAAGRPKRDAPGAPE